MTQQEYDELREGLTRLYAELTGQELEIAEDDDEVLETIENVEEVVDEAVDVLQTIDFEKLPDAIDMDHLQEALDHDELTPLEVIQSMNRRELLGAVDLTSLVNEADDLEDEVDEMTDADEGIVGDEDEDEESDMLDTFVDREGGDGDGIGEFSSEEVQLALQDAILEAVTEFREGLLEVHARFRQVYEENQERFDSISEKDTNSRNPTAYSTLPTRNASMTSTAIPSTVPRSARHSSIRNERRIYGPRFEQERDDE